MTTHKQVRSTEEALTLALEALKAMMQEFQGYDLPYGSKAYVLAKDACLFAEKALAQPSGSVEQICGFDVVLDESMPPNTFKLAQPAVASEQRSVNEHLEPVGINGLTEAETNATASVIGLVNTTTPTQQSCSQRQPLDIKTIKRIATYCGEHVTDEDVIEITRRVEAAHGIKE